VTSPRFISAVRVLAGLIVAPVIPNALSGLVVFFLSLGEIYGSLGKFMSHYMIVTQLWSLAVGLIVFLLLPRELRRVPLGSIVLGSVGAFLFPPAWLLFTTRALPTTITDVAIVALAGVLALPFGLFGGWIFWLLVVRPERVTNGSPARKAPL
jgi:hypothetical protein